MFHNDDIVEEITTGRQGKIDSIGAEGIPGHQIPNLWRVCFSDGKDQSLKYFKKEEELRLINCPHSEPEPGFCPERPPVDPL